MDKLTTETLLNIGEAAQRLPRSRHPSTIHRWRQRGCKGVLLECTLLGGQWFTSAEALDRFLAAVNAAAARGVPMRSGKENRAAAKRAYDTLEKHGLKKEKAK